MANGPGIAVRAAGGVNRLANEVELRLMYAENKACEDLAQAEGDRLLKAGDEKGGLAALKVAALLRRRRDEHLGPF